MEKFLEKFNIFDLFTMLIPGLIIACIVSVWRGRRIIEAGKSKEYHIFCRCVFLWGGFSGVGNKFGQAAVISDAL